MFQPIQSIQSLDILSVQVIENGLQERDQYHQPVYRDLAIVEAIVNGKKIPFTLSQFPEGWKLDLFSLGDVWQSASSQALPRL